MYRVNTNLHERRSVINGSPFRRHAPLEILSGSRRLRAEEHRIVEVALMGRFAVPSANVVDVDEDSLSKRVILCSVLRQLTDLTRRGANRRGRGAAHDSRSARSSKRPAHAKNLHIVPI